MNKVKFAYKHGTNQLKKKISTKTNKLLTKPLQIFIHPNKTCNAVCVMCDHWQEKNLYLTTEEMLAMLNELHEWLGDSIVIQISGGEPLIFKGVYDLIKFCSDRNIIVKLNTNGIALKNRKVIDNLLEAKLDFLSISIDSHHAEVHDKLRGYKGIFDIAINAIKELETVDLKVGIAAVVSQENIREFPETVEFFLSLPINRLLFQPLRLDVTEDPAVNDMWITDMEALDRTVEYLLNKKAEGDLRLFNSISDIKNLKVYFSEKEYPKTSCHIGYDRLIVDHKGNVFLGCPEYISIGNIKEGKIKDFWYSALAKRTRDDMSVCTLVCPNNCYKDLTIKDQTQRFFAILNS